MKMIDNDKKIMSLISTTLNKSFIFLNHVIIAKKIMKYAHKIKMKAQMNHNV